MTPEQLDEQRRAVCARVLKEIQDFAEKFRESVNELGKATENSSKFFEIRQAASGFIFYRKIFEIRLKEFLGEPPSPPDAPGRGPPWVLPGIFSI